MGSRIHRCEGPCLGEGLAHVPTEAHTRALSARIALRFHFTRGLLSVPASFMPSLNQLGFVWRKHGLARRVHRGPFWRLLQTHLLGDALPTHPDLARARGGINLFRMQFRELLVAGDALLREVEACGFSMLPQAGLPGSKRLCLFLGEVCGRLLNQGFALRLFGEQEAFQAC